MATVDLPSNFNREVVSRNHTLHTNFACSKQLRGLKAWLQCYHVFQPDLWLLFDMKMQVIPQKIPFLYQAHPSTCSLTTPRPHPLLLHRRGRFLPNIPEQPRLFKAEVLAMVVSFLNSMHLVYVMMTFHRMASQYDLPNHTNQQFL